MSIKDSPVFDRPAVKNCRYGPPAAIPLMLALQEGRERNPCRLGLFGQAGAAIGPCSPKDAKQGGKKENDPHYFPASPERNSRFP